jgi:hypothetical protein
MKGLIGYLTDDIAEKTQELDPYILAAWYHHHYVMIMLSSQTHDNGG